MLSIAVLSRLSFIDRLIPTRGQCVAGLALLLFALGFASSGQAQEWPQILGPNRDGSLQLERPLSSDWPQQAKIRWEIGLGSGYGGPAVKGKHVYTLHRLGNQELLEATDLTSGQAVWRAAWPASYRPSYSSDNGPRCVPALTAQQAVCYGAAGDLVCVNLDDGKLLWQRPLRQEYDAEDGYFGAGSSPLIVGDLIVVCLGGQKAGIIGIDLGSGKTRWTATDYDASYASPIAIDSHTALVVTRYQTLLIDLDDGSVLSQVAFGSRGPTVNAATPIPAGPGKIFMTASYGVGATLLALGDDRSLEPVFEGSRLLSSQYVTPVYVAGRVIGVDGREDTGTPSLRAVELSKQEVLWEEAGFGTAHLLTIGPRDVLAVKLDGQIIWFDAGHDQFAPRATMQLPPGSYRAPPALVDGELLVRDCDDSSGRSRLLCVPLPRE